MAEANFAKMTSMHFYGWKNGLKTGQYYLRSRPSRDAIKFTVDVEALLKANESGNVQDILKVIEQTNEKQVELMKKKKNDPVKDFLEPDRKFSEDDPHM